MEKVGLVGWEGKGNGGESQVPLTMLQSEVGGGGAVHGH